ncbi:hypothetical protein OUZ56_033807 [Daphnia magna]|uniref:Uncharacterized protein n=1 Tax=Daphnia magna TaxID=35525 RepID=A0ABQ9ZY95_9CRUS|nr:hypothetical protein OUZ56_033807 [Daphnia magna]
MSEAVAKAESIESGGNISIEDEMKPEAMKNEGPLLPDNDLKQKRGRRKAAHTKLTNQLRKAVVDHKLGAIRLKKLQVAAWRDELIRIYEDVKDLHHTYMESLPDITDPQRQACEKWEVQFDTDHVEILNIAIRYATSSRHSASSIGTTTSDVTVSTTLSRKRSTHSASNVSLGQPSHRDLCIQKQMLELEVKMERARIQMEASTTSATETLSKALKGMGEHLSKLIDSAEKTSSEIAANTNLVKDSRQSLREMDQKIKEVNLDLNAQIEGLKTTMEVNKIHLRTIQEQVLDQETRLPKRSQSLAATQDIPARASLKSIEATVMHRRDLSNRYVPAGTSAQDPTRRPLPIMPSTCNPCPSPGDDASSDTTPEPPPAAGPSNHPHGGCCSRPPKFRALYEQEYNGSPALLFMLEELLSKEVRNEIGECLADEAMYSVVWERLDAVYGRTEVMDQTYLDDLLQIPPLKSQDAASLKTFANRLHGAVVTLSQSRYAHELHSRTTLMAMEAKLTTYLKEKWNEKRKRTGAELNVLDLDDWVTVKSMIRFDEKKPVKKQNAAHTSTIGHVSTEEGSKSTASSPPEAAPRENNRRRRRKRPERLTNGGA